MTCSLSSLREKAIYFQVTPSVQLIRFPRALRTDDLYET